MIYCNVINDRTVGWLSAYSKTKFDNLPVKTLKELNNGIPKKSS